MIHDLLGSCFDPIAYINAFLSSAYSARNAKAHRKSTKTELALDSFNFIEKMYTIKAPFILVDLPGILSILTQEIIEM